MTSEKAFAAHTRIDYHIANHAGPWASFAPLSADWSVSGIARYRLTADNELQLDAVIQAPGSSVNGVTIATFPLGFRPPFTRGLWVGATTANNAAGAVQPAGHGHGRRGDAVRRHRGQQHRLHRGEDRP